MKKILISDQKHARDNTQYFYPYIVISRKDIADTNVNEVADVLLDGVDTEILDVFTKATKAYLPNSIDFLADVDTINKALAQRVSYETPHPAFNIDDNYITGDSLSNCPPPNSIIEEIETEIPMMEQIAILEPLLTGKRIGAGTIAELTAQLVDLCKTNNLFVRDTITGLFRSCFARKPLISADQANTIFSTHFCDKLAIKTTDYKIDKTTGETVQNTKYRPIKPDELKLLWKNVALYSTFNSRKEFFDSIPEWDGEERIGTFMKKYFECDTNPNFFMLLMTCIIGKMVNPSRTNTPFFFDIVAESKGIGKSYLCRRLLLGKYCGFLRMSKNRGMSDFFVDAYDGNNILVVDDECTWCGSGNDKLSYDEFKTLVSTTTDKFSRKMQQPEEHERSFIIVRTSNYVNQVYAPNERRQIVFQCNLQEQECRILDLPDSFFEQMLAEAKDYYVKHGGIYELTPDDKLEVKNTNLDNYNWETKENYAILEYIKAVRSDPDKWGASLEAKKFANDKWGSHQKYTEWCDEKRKPSLQSRGFWRAVSALSELPENHIAVLSNSKYDIAGGGKCRVFRIDPLPLTAEEKAIADMEDMPY